MGGPTKDIDLSGGAPAPELVVHFEGTLGEARDGFQFRRQGEPHVMPNAAIRLDVAVQCYGAPRNTTPLLPGHALIVQRGRSTYRAAGLGRSQL